MKKATIAVIALSVSLFATTSCNKKYTCRCTLNYTGMPGIPDSVVKEYEITDTKSAAEDKCKKESGTYVNNGITTTESCDLY